MKFILVPLVILVAINLTAQTIPPSSEPASRMKQMLGLTDEQEKKASAIFTDTRSKIEKKNIEIAREALNLKEEMLKEKPDQGKIKSIFDRKALLEGERSFFKTKAHLDFQGLLTKEQIEKTQKIDHLKKMMRGRHHGMTGMTRQHHQPMPPPQSRNSFRGDAPAMQPPYSDAQRGPAQRCPQCGKKPE